MISIKTFLKKYKDIPLPIKASIWFAVCNFLQKGISMITLPIFTRLLTTEQYGTYTLYQSWYGLITIIATLNLAGGVFNNGMVKFEDKREQYTSALNGLSITVTAVLFLIYLIGHSYFNKILGLSTLLMIAMFIELLFAPAYSLWSVRQRFDYKYKQLVAVTLFIAIMGPAVGIIAVLLSEHKAEARILSFVGVQVFVGIILTYVNFYKGKKFYLKSFWKYALWFNIPLIPHYISVSVLGQADRIMIGKMIGLSEAAIYGLAYNISQMLQLITSAVNSSFIPYSYRAIKDKRYTDIEKSANALLIAWAFILIMIVCFGPEIIQIFASKDYYAARWIIPPVSLSVYYTFLYNIFANIEFYFEANKVIMITSVVCAVTNIILNYIFIPIFGYIAAGYTTLICYVLYSLGHYIFHIMVLNKHLNKTRIFNGKYILLLSVLLTAFVLCISFVYDIIIARYLIILFAFLITIAKRRYFIDLLKGMKK